MRRLRRLNYAITIRMILQSGYTFVSLKQALGQYRTRLYDAVENGEHVDDVTIILLQYLSDVSKRVGKILSDWTSTWGEIPSHRKSFALATTATVTWCYLNMNLQALLRIRPTRLALTLMSLKRSCACAVDFGLLRERLLLKLLLYEGLTAKEICLIRSIDVECNERGCILQVRKTNRCQRTRLDQETQWAFEDYLDELDPEVQFLLPARYSWEMTEQALRNELKRYLVYARPLWASEQKHRFWFGCRMIEYAQSYRLARILRCSTFEPAMVYVWKAIWELMEEVMKRFEPEGC